MKILLFNDNPVVRKLVALSAQKTKDELNVIWSIDELDNTSYDLLIVDDALYSDDIISELKARIAFKATLMMATRGNSVPAGFDHVIHKPFLPTDLVDLFAQIDKSVSPVIEKASVDESVKAINLEDELEGFEDTIAIDDLPDLGDLDLDEVPPVAKTTILDHEEVQEVQNLLEDEESYILDELGESHEIPMMEHGEDLDDDLLNGLNIDDLTAETDNDLGALLDELELDDELSEEVALAETSESMDDLVDTSVDEEMLAALENAASDGDEIDESDLDALLAGLQDEPIEADETRLEETSLAEDFNMEKEDTEVIQMAEEDLLSEDEGLLDELEEEGLSSDIDEDDLLMDDEEMGALEQQIQEAVGDLDMESLGIELDESMIENLGIESLDGIEALDGLSGLDEIDEKAMKIAVGEAEEEIDEEDILVEDNEESADEVPVTISSDTKAPDGVEALQVLLKTLANEEVVKSLKGLNISININFGNNS